MDITTYVKNRGGEGTVNCPVLASVASEAGCSHRTLYMIALGHKPAGPKLARAIEEATAGAVTRHDLRPDVFGPAPERSAA